MREVASGAGWEGDEALKRSDEMTKVEGVKKALLWPYVGLICGMRLVSMGRTPILAALPAHIIREVPEIPFIIYCSLLFLSVVLSRCVHTQLCLPSDLACFPCQEHPDPCFQVQHTCCQVLTKGILCVLVLSDVLHKCTDAFLQQNMFVEVRY